MTISSSMAYVYCTITGIGAGLKIEVADFCGKLHAEDFHLEGWFFCGKLNVEDFDWEGWQSLIRQQVDGA